MPSTQMHNYGCQYFFTPPEAVVSSSSASMQVPIQVKGGGLSVESTTLPCENILLRIKLTSLGTGLIKGKDDKVNETDILIYDY